MRMGAPVACSQRLQDKRLYMHPEAISSASCHSHESVQTQPTAVYTVNRDECLCRQPPVMGKEAAKCSASVHRAPLCRRPCEHLSKDARRLPIHQPLSGREPGVLPARFGPGMAPIWSRDTLSRFCTLPSGRVLYHLIWFPYSLTGSQYSLNRSP